MTCNFTGIDRRNELKKAVVIGFLGDKASALMKIQLSGMKSTLFYITYICDFSAAASTF
jgi:hypothetical protein